jgi:hypothetical protein
MCRRGAGWGRIGCDQGRLAVPEPCSKVRKKSAKNAPRRSQPDRYILSGAGVEYRPEGLTLIVRETGKSG